MALAGLVFAIVVATPLVAWWAHAYAEGALDQPKGDVLIVLAAAADDAHGIAYSSYWRARMAALAWKSGGFKKVVVSGGGGPGIEDFLMAEGVPRSAIVAEWDSRSTRQNALAVKRLTADMPGTKVLLTSDFHMFRALRVFRKLDIQVTPMAVPDVLHETENWYGRIPGFETMSIETVKIVYYKLRGWM
ncbi:MAG TPA: YdcF family protein [Terracidiphilus sp.]|nr:YdcF family protein [Terracidiphilus sp.]